MNVKGVRYCNNTNRYIAFWTKDGIKRNKSFCVDKWGKDKAFQLACIARWTNTSDNLPFSIKAKDIAEQAHTILEQSLIPWCNS